ncbi:MAG: hypothetical protein ACFFDF_16230 [Candidatus Odinarchaeota archaeon]
MQDFTQKEPKYKRSTDKFSRTFNATPEQIFPLLCPTREADWIPGWEAELIYTKSGYAEDKCVFRTDPSNSMGGTLWTFTGYKPNKYVEFVRFEPDILLHVKIDVIQNDNETTTMTWNITSTAISEKGNSLIKNTKSNHKPNHVLIMMEHYLKTGKLISKTSLLSKRV